MSEVQRINKTRWIYSKIDKQTNKPPIEDIYKVSVVSLCWGITPMLSERDPGSLNLHTIKGLKDSRGHTSNTTEQMQTVTNQ